MVGLLQEKNDQTVTASTRSQNYDCANVYVRVLCLSQHHTNVKDFIRRKSSPPHPHSTYHIHLKHSIQLYFSVEQTEGKMYFTPLAFNFHYVVRPVSVHCVTLKREQ